MDSINDIFEDRPPIMDERQAYIPTIGMKFDTLDGAFEFWKAYGKKMGFGVRKEYSNRNRKSGIITNYLFVCYKEGYKKKKQESVDIPRRRSDVRTGCNSRLKVSLDRECEKYIVKEFVEEHNHELQPPETSHMLRSHRELTRAHALAIELASDSGLTPKATHELMSREAGGKAKLGFVAEDQKTYLKSRRKRDMVTGELGSVLTYFQKQNMIDPKFYYALQLDSEELVTNIFWADAKMVTDYDVFGDVVTFDTTFGTNKEFRPLGVFTGYNNHRQIVIFGASLLYDETAESFMWLFETFVNAHNGKKPRTIFTDQDIAMASALEMVWPRVYHGLCSWHLMQNGIKHLSCYMKKKSPFLMEFKRCMYEYTEEEEFDSGWKKLLEDYNLKENNWLTRMYGLRKKWARAYIKGTFTLGIRSTQISESLNSDLKDHLKSDLNICDFFKHFDRVVEEKRYNELGAEFRMRQNVPSLGFSKSPLLKDASEKYTPKFFDIFKEEFGFADSVVIKYEFQDTHEYVVALHSSLEKEYKVVCDPSNDVVVGCSCMNFESKGILCCHVLRVFSQLNILKIPEKYILKRLTRVVRSQYVLDERKMNEEEDAKQWVRRVQSQLLRLTYQASMDKDSRACMERMIDDCIKNLEKFTLGKEVAFKEVIEKNVSNRIENVKGLKKKEGRKGKRRIKPQYEIHQRKVKKYSDSNVDDCSSLHLLKNVSCSTAKIPQHANKSILDLNSEPSQDDETLSLSAFPFPSIDVWEAASRM